MKNYTFDIYIPRHSGNYRGSGNLCGKEGTHNLIKIVHVSTPLSWRGGERQLLLLLQASSKFEGIEQFVYCPEGSELAKRVKHLSHVHLFSHPKKRSGFDIPFAAGLNRLCRVEKIDLLHVHDSHAHTAAYLAALLFRNRLPVVVSRRVDFPVASSILSTWKYTHTNVRAILCVSDAITNIVKAALPDSKARIQTVHSGIDISENGENAVRSLHKELGIDAERKLIINASALEDHKDYPTFIRTIELLHRKGRNVQGVIYGTGSLQVEFERLSEELGIADRIRFAGFDPNVRECLAAADVFLFTSKMEGLGTIVLDAFAAGVPVVATNAGGIPEMVKDGETGVLCGIGKVEELAIAVERVLDDAEFAGHLVAGARQQLAAFSSAETARKSIDVYRSVLHENL
ncbi:MAG: glycosyltransferase [Flavobacteriales bacterium]|nr:glycosyltransferase [Flavobacteriales bacterium]